MEPLKCHHPKTNTCSDTQGLGTLGGRTREGQLEGGRGRGAEGQEPESLSPGASLLTEMASVTPGTGMVTPP